MSNDNAPHDEQNRPAVGVPVERIVRPLTEPVTLADVLDALNCFNRPNPDEDDGPWEAEHYIRVDHLPAFINTIAATWFAPEATLAAERERCAMLCEAARPLGGRAWSTEQAACFDALTHVAERIRNA